MATIVPGVGGVVALGSVCSRNIQNYSSFVVLDSQFMREEMTIEIIKANGIWSGGYRSDKRVVFLTESSKYVGD